MGRCPSTNSGSWKAGFLSSWILKAWLGTFLLESLLFSTN